MQGQHCNFFYHYDILDRLQLGLKKLILLEIRVFLDGNNNGTMNLSAVQSN